MIKASFISRATELGFKPGSPSDPNETLAEIVESRIPTYWEAFPGLLVNAAEGGEFSPAATAALLDESGKVALNQLFLVALGLYEALGEHFSWRRRLFPDLPARQVFFYHKRNISHNRWVFTYLNEFLSQLKLF